MSDLKKDQDIDLETGVETTGHEWDGIKELNNPLPRWWLWTFYLCIDACDDVMDKISKPRGLIDYLALADEPEERAGKPPKPIWKHVLRILLYGSLVADWLWFGVCYSSALILT